MHDRSSFGISELDCQTAGSTKVPAFATDGIGNPPGSGQGGVGNLFRDVLIRSSAPSLIEFAHAVDFSRETFDDDRTLVAVWPRKESSRSTPAQPRQPSKVDGLR
jgi:hypothetical protein